MKREQCLKNAKLRMEEIRIQRDLIATIPLNIPISITYKCPVKSKNWDWESILLVCEVLTFNILSIKVHMIAVDNAGAYPFDMDIERRKQNRAPYIVHSLNFKRIDSWKHFNPENLPLLLGWPNQYPRLAELLKGRP